MATYLKKFENHTLYETYINGGDAVLPNVSICATEEDVHYNPYVHDYSKDYLTFVSLSDNNAIGWKSVQQSSNDPVRTISYSTDKTNWTSVASTSAGVTLATLNNGDKLYLKGTENNYSKFYQGTSWSQFTSSGQFTAEGNIMSLIGGDNFSGLTSFTSSNEGAFVNLFRNCTSLIDISNLILPATTLAHRCYSSMFKGCTGLTTAPELPATTLANYCYNSMFHGCTSLTTAPSLSATTLTDSCYYQMFYGCTTLATAPALPATTLTDSCYYQMFQGCTSLNSITCLATDISATNCTNNWVNNVSNSGTFTKNVSMSGWTTGASGIPSNWTVVDAS